MADDPDRTQEQKPRQPNPALKALKIMVGEWDLQGRDFTSGEEIHGQSSFEWLEGGFFLLHKFNFDYADRRFNGIEFIGFDEKSGHLKTHVFTSENPGPLEYTWEVDESTFTNWFGDVGASNHYHGKFSEDRNTLIGQWEWPGGGYTAVMVRSSITEMMEQKD